MQQHDHQKLPPRNSKCLEIDSVSTDSRGTLCVPGSSYSTPLFEKLYITVSSIAMNRPTITSFARLGRSKLFPYYGHQSTPPAPKIANSIAI
jgi:hypothetical protein